MRLLVAGSLTLALALFGQRAAGFEGELEVGPFFHQLTDGQPDWLGQRLLMRLRPMPGLTTQVEFVNANRGGDSGQMASLALWKDVTPHVFAVTNLAISRDADFFPDWRGDLELHLKVPRAEQLVLFAGTGRTRFEDADVWTGTAGAAHYFAFLGGGSISYRFTYFDNDFDATSIWATARDGRSHIAQLVLGRDDGRWGQLELRYLYGTDLLRDFVATTGEDLRFRSHVAYLGWRRRWTRRLGTYLLVEWGKQQHLTERRGAELRLVWHFGRDQLDR